MDFTALLNLASKNKVVNEKTASSSIGYSTELGPPKRVTAVKPKGVLSASVKAFLDKKEQEEKVIELAAQKKKDALLAIRKEHKSTRKATAMAKRTKDNLKSWSDDQLIAMREQEKVDLQKLEEKRLAFIKKLGESEKRGSCGGGSRSVSKMAPESLSDRQRAKDKALMAKYDQDDDSDDDSGDVKCDVITPEKKIWDNEAYKRKDKERHSEIINRKSSHKSSDSKDKHKSRDKSKNKKSSDKQKDKHKDHRHCNDKKLSHKKNSTQVKVVKKNKIVRRAHLKPALTFQDLINMANDKHKEVQEPSPVPQKKPETKKPKPSRPMTQEEKDRFARRSTKEYKEWYLKGGTRPGLASTDDSDKPSANGAEQQYRGQPAHQRPSKDKLPALTATPSANSSIHNGGRERSKSAPGPSSEQMAKLIPKSNDNSTRNGKVPAKAPSSSGPPLRHSSGVPPKGGATNSGALMGSGRAQGTPQAAKRSAPAPVKKPEPELNPFDRIYNEIKKKNPKPEKRRRVIESEDEDSEEEMDDFIADSDDDNFIDDSGPVDVSSAIRDIFGYDKRRFRNERVDDIADMDASFGQTLKEEARSAKLGRLEDLEDMRLEEEEKKKKMMLKKKNVKRR